MEPFSVLPMFKVGIGPSSSHTLGPMLAAAAFSERLMAEHGEQVYSVSCELFGSLALTGEGHATDKALILGLLGMQPETLEPDVAEAAYAAVKVGHQLRLADRLPIHFNPQRHILYHCDVFLPAHPNGMRLSADDKAGNRLLTETWFSVGGGYIVSADDIANLDQAEQFDHRAFPFDNAAQLLTICQNEGVRLATIARRNERALGCDDAAIDQHLDLIKRVMLSAIERGCEQEGILPGGLQVVRRAPQLHQRLKVRSLQQDPLALMDWVSMFALAVNEENANGGQVVTAPTNGAAGVIPAVLAYYLRFVAGATDAGAREFLLTAAVIGWLYKRNASISAAEVGCQGEIGVASSMAAGALCAVLGGSVAQAENAAEMAMEHHLGMTCDPAKGLVQVPCIERNAMGAIKAINAARLALLGDGQHRVSLDAVIETMRQTGADMQSKYKETALGGLAVNIVLC
ncbi:L-serine ammonia-lyase [Corallincola spongiicola]|uniref:L-serine dehydratase n=1 Tax=Corallincola spongiicola TaxID=2520508 RepID=A0ABY1WQY0_9GAMM|nr:L-serine ammonia-lyase [Corallincola spongiicola]TAA47132.1 L-serine ammonia-lyase [Corallincola spongiicola]